MATKLIKQTPKGSIEMKESFGCKLYFWWVLLTYIIGTSLWFQVKGAGVQQQQQQQQKPSNKHLYSISKLSIKTKIQNHCFSIYFDAIIYQPRQKNKTHHCFLIYYSAIIYAISIYRFFTSFQFINLSNLKILVIVLCVSNMG